MQPPAAIRKIAGAGIATRSVTFVARTARTHPAATIKTSPAKSTISAMPKHADQTSRHTREARYQR